MKISDNEMTKNVGVRRFTPTYAMVVIATLSCAMFGCSGETATAGTVRVVKSFEADYPLTELAWHPNGKELAVGQSLHRKVTVWDVTTGKLLRTIDNEPGAVNALAYSPDGRFLAVGRGFSIGAGKPHAHLYDAATGELMRSFIPPPPEPRHSNEAHALAFSPDSRRLVVDGYVTSNAGVVYELETGQAVCTYAEDEPNNPFNLTYSLAFNPDGKTFAVGRIDGTLELWSAGDCKQVKEIKKVDNVGINALSFTSDGKYLASASYGAGELVRQGKPKGSDPIQVRDTRTFEKVKGFYSVLYGAMRSLHFFHGDKYLLAGGGGKSIQVWDVESGGLVDTIQGFSDVAHVSPRLDGKYFATVSGDEIKIWEFIR